MKKILLIFMFISSFSLANSLCGLDKAVVKELEKKYSKEIQKLDYKFEEGYRNPNSTCQKIQKTDKVVLALPYAMGDENSYTLSLILAIVNHKTREIEQSYFHNEITESNAIYVSDLELDTSLYNKKTLQLSLSLVGSSRANPYRMNKMFLYKIKEDGLSIMLDGLELLELQGENDMCNYYDGVHTYEWIDKKSFKEASPIRFKHQYSYEESSCKEEEDEKSWDVVLEQLNLIFKNGEYHLKNKIKPIFNLKEIEANTKKGLKYKKRVLKAMLFEETLFSSNVNRYNNIAYYLQKAGHNQEAIFLLEEILSEFPKRVVAYLNLGDAYWDETERVKALNNYHHYVKLMKKEQKEKRIPSYVLKRIEESKDFSKGFIEKYKEVQTLAPIFLKEMKETKPLEIVPWMQKTILTVEKENGILVNVLAYEKDDDVEIVYFVQTLMEKENRDEDIEYAKGKIIMYKFSFKERDITTLSLYDSTILLGKKGFDGTTLDGWTFYNLQEFILDKGYLYFDVKSCESKKGSNHIDAFCYKSKYRFGDNNITDSNDYMTKNWYKRWNHKHDTFVYSGDSFNIGQIENNKTVTKSLFTIKSFKNKIIREESIPFTIGGVSWSEDDKVLYFDNHDIELACIWRYDLESKELSKIVPEHEAQQPFAFTFRGKEYIIYIEGQDIKVATEKE